MQMTLCYWLGRKRCYRAWVDRLIEIGRRYGMEMNVIRISRQPSPHKNYDRSKTIGECGILKLFV
jgi:hypothetical protein